MTETKLNERMNKRMDYPFKISIFDYVDVIKEVEALESRLAKALTKLCWCYGTHCHYWVKCHDGCAAWSIQPIEGKALGGGGMTNEELTFWKHTEGKNVPKVD